jgi:hypothetical protein
MKYTLILSTLLLVGCTNKFDECVEKEKQIYRQQNPKASYGLIQSKTSEFELMCSKYKQK